MTEISYHPISEVDFGALTTSFNYAYSDYLTPISMTTRAFRALIAREDLMLEDSVAAIEDGEIIGMGFLGIREKHAWIGGMGVIPGRRRRGIGRQIMQHLLNQARAHELEAVQLEVIEANHGAHALYQQLGFQHVRYLHIMERASHNSAPLPELEHSYHVLEEELSAVLAHYDRFHDVRNCWQRGRASLYGLATSQAVGLAALSDTGIAGYAGGWLTPHEVRFAELATDPALGDARPAVAAAILAYAHHKYPHAQGNAYNVADDDPIRSAYEHSGYKTDFRQIEMRFDLTTTS